MADEITPTLEELINMGIDTRLLDIYTMMPGIVQSYDASKQMCSVQPCPKTEFNDGTIIPLPVINNVPVAHLRAGKSIIHVPLKAGDSVELHFSNRSIDNWKSQGGIYDPADPRTHALSDCIAYPGGYAISQALTIPNPKMLTIMNDKAYIEVQPNGTFKVMNSAQDVELFDLLTRLIEAIITARTETLLGPQPLVNEVIGEEFETLLLYMTELKGS